MCSMVMFTQHQRAHRQPDVVEMPIEQRSIERTLETDCSNCTGRLTGWGLWPSARASAYSLEFTELEDEISSAKMPDILAHILGQIGANMPVILKYPQMFLARTKKVKKWLKCQ
jgi:hypothetical protein